MDCRAGVIGLAAGVLLLAGCHQKVAKPTINNSMTEVMEPQAETIWNIVSRAYNDIGDALDGSKLKDADWIEIGKAAKLLQDRALVLAETKDLKVVNPGEQILGEKSAGEKGNIGKDWEAVSGATVQKRIDGNPELFARHARELADSAGGIAQAALSKDTAKLYKITSNLDEVCDGCHEPFWGTDEPPPFPHPEGSPLPAPKK